VVVNNSQFSNSVSVLLGDGAGSFSAAANSPFAVDNTPRSVAVGDFNNDGRQDLAVGNFGSVDVSILLGDCVTTPTPTLGNYPDTSIPLSTSNTITPDAAPANTTSINVSTSSNFKGQLEIDPATGVVRVTDAHPAGSYAVTVTAFNGAGATATKTFTLTVTTPASCPAISFAGGLDFSWVSPIAVTMGDFNGDGQDLAVANIPITTFPILLADGGQFQSATNFAAGAGPESVRWVISTAMVSRTWRLLIILTATFPSC
jgi:hypothetical protein